MKLLIGLSLIASANAEIRGECPTGHNYAFDGGSSCCHFPDEANRPFARRFPSCDSGPLGLDSWCCKGDNSVKCPYGNGGCRSIERETCYVDGESVAVGVPSDKFQKQCMDRAKSDPDLEVYTVTEAFTDRGWTDVGGCEYNANGTNYSCNRNRVSAGSKSNGGSSSAGLTRALADPPRARRCNPPRRWRQIRGKLRCRRPRN